MGQLAMAFLFDEVTADARFQRLLANRKQAWLKVNDETGLIDVDQWEARLHQSAVMSPDASTQQNVDDRVYLVRTYNLKPDQLQLILEEFVVKDNE